MSRRKSSVGKPPETLARLQARFAGHIRDPEAVAAPEGLEDRHMAIYRDLFFGNLNGLLGRSFPVLRRLHDEQEWDRLIRAFMRDHRATTPMFTELPGEFVQFLAERHEPGQQDPPFFAQLARYEWLESALKLDSTDLEAVPAEVDGDVLANPPVVSPLAWLEAFHYPVHRIRPDFIPRQPESDPVYLLLYRTRDDQVGFYRLNPVSARLFTLLRDEPGPSGLEQIRRVAAELHRPDDAQVIQGGREILAAFRARDILLGTGSTRQPAR